MKTTQNLKPQETQFGFKWMDPELSSRHDGRVTSFKDGKWRVKRGCYPRLCSATVYHYYSTFKQAMMDRYSVASKSVLVLVEVEVVVPVVVITELEAKRNDPELGYFARQALRHLDSLPATRQALRSIQQGFNNFFC